MKKIRKNSALDFKHTVEEVLYTTPKCCVCRVLRRDWDMRFKAAVYDSPGEEYGNWEKSGFHPNTAGYYYSFTYKGQTVVCTELTSSDTFNSKLLTAKTRSGDPRNYFNSYGLGIAVQLARGLAHIADAGAVHGNINPETVKITKSGVVKIDDFVGGRKTEDYTAPEVAAGKAPTAAADVYSVGRLLSELFRRKSSDTLKEIIANCLNNEPNDRISAKCLKEKLEELYQAVVKSPFPYSDPDPKSPEVKAGYENNRALALYDTDTEGAEKLLTDNALNYPEQREIIFNYMAMKNYKGEADSGEFREKLEQINAFNGKAVKYYYSMCGSEVFSKSFSLKDNSDANITEIAFGDDNTLYIRYFKLLDEYTKVLDLSNGSIRDLKAGESDPLESCTHSFFSSDMNPLQQDYAIKRKERHTLELFRGDNGDIRLTDTYSVNNRSVVRGVHTFGEALSHFCFNEKGDTIAFANPKLGIILLWRIPERVKPVFLFSRIHGKLNPNDEERFAAEYLETAEKQLKKKDYKGVCETFGKLSKLHNLGKDERRYFYLKRKAAQQPNMIKSNFRRLSARVFNTKRDPLTYYDFTYDGSMIIHYGGKGCSSLTFYGLDCKLLRTVNLPDIPQDKVNAQIPSASDLRIIDCSVFKEKLVLEVGFEFYPEISHVIMIYDIGKNEFTDILKEDDEINKEIAEYKSRRDDTKIDAEILRTVLPYGNILYSSKQGVPVKTAADDADDSWLDPGDNTDDDPYDGISGNHDINIYDLLGIERDPDEEAEWLEQISNDSGLDEEDNTYDDIIPDYDDTDIYDLYDVEIDPDEEAEWLEQISNAEPYYYDEEDEDEYEEEDDLDIPESDGGESDSDKDVEWLLGQIPQAGSSIDYREYTLVKKINSDKTVLLEYNSTQIFVYYLDYDLEYSGDSQGLPFEEAAHQNDNERKLILMSHENIDGLNNPQLAAIMDKYGLLNEYKKLSEALLTNPFTRLQNNIKIAADMTDEEADGADGELGAILQSDRLAYEEMKKDAISAGVFWGRNEKGALNEQKSALEIIIRALQGDVEKTPPITTQELTFEEPENKPYGKAVSELAKANRSDLLDITLKTENIKAKLKEVIKGQDYAIDIVCDQLFSAFTTKKFENGNSPKAIFTFAGSPGVGKTFLAQKTVDFLKEEGMSDYVLGRFNMSEFAGAQAEEGLIGFDFTYKNATEGRLTKFVRENPRCVLLFDEIEKAGSSVIKLFYQMLDAGILTDKYWATMSKDASGDRNLPKQIPDPDVSFKDAIIIFTSNLGEAIYNDAGFTSGADVSARTILNAFKTEINPATQSPYFPEAFISRLSTGQVLMFNKLSPDTLTQILKSNIEKTARDYHNNFGIALNYDESFPLTFLFGLGGSADARMLTKKADDFLSSTLHDLANNKSFDFSKINEIKFNIPLETASDEIKGLYNPTDDANRIRALIYCSEEFRNKYNSYFGDFNAQYRSDINDALAAVYSNEPDIVFMDITDSLPTDNENNISRIAECWQNVKTPFNELHKKLPQVPIYIIDNNGGSRDFRERLIKEGAREIPDLENSNPLDTISAIGREVYLEKSAAALATGNRRLDYDTIISVNGNTAEVTFCGLKPVSSPMADDLKNIVNDFNRPNVRFKDVIGAKSAKKELEKFKLYFKNPNKYVENYGKPPRGVLLYGAPGTGKTMLAKALAGECGACFIESKASAFVTKYAGSGPQAIRDLFKSARKYAPSIVFIDEVDTIGRKRTGSETSRFEEDTLNALLAEMEGFNSSNKHPVFVLAATNYGIKAGDGGIGILDEAFTRRFDKTIRMELPRNDERTELIKRSLEKIKDENRSITEDEIAEFSGRLMGLSPAIIIKIIDSAKEMSIDRNEPLCARHLNEALEQHRFGDERPDISPEDLLSTARHEAGHAVVNYLCGNTPSYLTIEARGDFGGYMAFSEDELNKMYKNREDIINDIRCSLGGRAAEMIYYGDKGITSGASADLRMATQSAKIMITRYGMSREFGMAVMDDNTAADNEQLRTIINSILKEQLECTIEILKQNKELLDTLSETLLKKKCLTSSEIKAVLNDTDSEKQPS